MFNSNGNRNFKQTLDMLTQQVINKRITSNRQGVAKNIYPELFWQKYKF